MVSRAIPDDVAPKLKIRVGACRRGDVGSGGRRAGRCHRKLLPLAGVPVRIENDVVVDGRDFGRRLRTGVASSSAATGASFFFALPSDNG